MFGGDRGQSIASTLVLVALALAVPFALLAGVAAKLYVDGERSRLATIGALSSSRLHDKVDLQLAAMVATASALARFADADAKNLDAFEARARALAQAEGYGVELSAPDGRHLVDTRIPPGQPLPAAPRPDIAAAPLAAQRPVVSGVMIHATSGHTVISASAPVMREGRASGVVSVVTDVGRFERVFAEAGISAPFYAYIYDRSGQVIAHMPGAPLEGSPHRSGQARIDPDSRGETDASADPSMIAFPETSALSGWTMVTGLPRSVLDEAQHRALALFAGAAALVLGSGVLIWIAIRRRAEEAARSLAAAAAGLSREEPTTPAPTAIREAGIVGDALAVASRQLAGRRAETERVQRDLEARVTELTHGREQDSGTERHQADALRVAEDKAALAQARAEHALRSKTEFLALVSHEIRTSLSSVKGYAELLSDTEPLSAEQSHYMCLIEEAAATMLLAVDDIVDLADVETGTIRLDPQPFALETVFEKVLAFLKPAAARSGVTIGLTFEQGLPRMVVGDERRLRQVLINLITVLVRSRRGAQIDVSVKRDRAGDEPDRIGITLSSTGGSATSHEPGKLGMTIAQRLIRLMGGHCEILIGAAALSRCHFTCRLPAGGRPSGTRTSSARILVVEEDAVDQETARAILDRAGYTVDAVNEGMIALAALQRGRYDLVLLSLQAEAMDGLMLARAIRALDHSSRDLPIVAMSAAAMPEHTGAVLDARINAYLAKPLSAERLLTAVEAQLTAIAAVEASPAASECGPNPAR